MNAACDAEDAEDAEWECWLFAKPASATPSIIDRQVASGLFVRLDRRHAIGFVRR